ncbi:DUF1877 family protein [Flavobacterium qiangtangense]|uniref:DUF1877 family protein n=1 Tax=Flavobacterium qiangtangense TaxID=1442595 RepID=A0ABW1PS09_9FLAO
MGMILEFYRLSDEKIIKLKNQSEQSFAEYLEQNYASVYGKEHKENDTVFSLDKTWDVIRFLIIEADKTEHKILSGVYGEPLNGSFYNGYNFLFSENVKLISHTLQKIHYEDLLKFYNEEKMKSQMIYNATNFQLKFLKEEFEILKLAFEKSSQLDSALIINIG